MISLNFTLERVSDPEIEPLTLAEMKTHLRQFDGVTALDDSITELIKGSREWVEDFTGRALIDQTWRLTIGDYRSRYANVDSDTVTGYYQGPYFPRADGGIMLRKSPVLSIVSFESLDAEGVATVIDPATYMLHEADSKWPRLGQLSGPTWLNGRLQIVFRAGYADRTGSPIDDASVVPVRFKQAMKLWAEAMHDRDEKMMPILLETAERLIKPERVELSIA